MSALLPASAAGSLLAAEETQAFPAWMVGLVTLLILLGMLMATLSFGKGRDHT